jgi:hypothetical protein
MKGSEETKKSLSNTEGLAIPSNFPKDIGIYFGS